jgi:hypothetical protein
MKDHLNAAVANEAVFSSCFPRIVACRAIADRGEERHVLTTFGTNDSDRVIDKRVSTDLVPRFVKATQNVDIVAGRLPPLLQRKLVFAADELEGDLSVRKLSGVSVYRTIRSMFVFGSRR